MFHPYLSTLGTPGVLRCVVKVFVLRGQFIYRLHSDVFTLNISHHRYYSLALFSLRRPSTPSAMSAPPPWVKHDWAMRQLHIRGVEGSVNDGPRGHQGGPGAKPGYTSTNRVTKSVLPRRIDELSSDRLDAGEVLVALPRKSDMEAFDALNEEKAKRVLYPKTVQAGILQ